MGQLISEDGPRRFYRGLYHGQSVVLKVPCKGLVSGLVSVCPNSTLCLKIFLHLPEVSAPYARSTALLFGMHRERLYEAA